MLDIKKIINDSIDVKTKILQNCIDQIKFASEIMIKACKNDKKILGEMVELGDINICIPSDDTQRIQEGHLMVEHILCEYVEASTV